MTHIKGLDHIKGRPQLDGPGDEIIPAQGRYHDGLRMTGKASAPHFFQKRVAVHLRHDDVGNHDLKRLFTQQLERLRPVSGLPYQRNPLLLAQILRHFRAGLHMIFYDQNSITFHSSFLHFLKSSRVL